MSKRPGILACVLALLVVALPIAAGAQQVSTRAPIRSPETRAYSIPAGELAKLMSRKPGPVIIDVREKAEFDVSQLKGAVHLPHSATDNLQATIARTVRLAKSRSIVFYCTTSGRSTQLADTIHLDLVDAGVTQVMVLSNGIIGWANDGYPLVDRAGRSTRLVHTHDAETAKLMRDPARARYGEKL